MEHESQIPKLASEFHLFGTSCLKLKEAHIGLANAKRPIIYTVADFPEGPFKEHEKIFGVTAESYKGFSGADVVVVEPPHRGDRDRALDGLPFHSMVRRSYQVQGERRSAFLKEFEALLQDYGV